jgi:YidC/Oxa1 family membrane protein insertase
MLLAVLIAGITDPIQRPLTALLEWLHASVGLTWAWSIIALTLIVRFAIVPLTVKQIRSMQKLQQHAPELKAIQAKYKNRKSREDRQRMNEEVMRFYKENKVNPAASCLPLIVQIPIFISLFFVLNNFEKNVLPEYPASEIGWLGIVPDITADVNAHWSGWLLLVVYVVSQLASIISMPTTDPRQRYIFVALPLIFIPFILTFPVGLMLYWATTNLWTVGQGLVTRRLVPRKQLPPPKRTSRTPPKEAAAEDGDVAKAVQSSRGATPGQAGQQRVRRRKKKGPRSRR